VPRFRVGEKNKGVRAGNPVRTPSLFQFFRRFQVFLVSAPQAEQKTAPARKVSPQLPQTVAVSF
jgi:hypothetical protein